jgi:hypothetical protein
MPRSPRRGVGRARLTLDQRDCGREGCDGTVDFLGNPLLLTGDAFASARTLL